MPRVFSTKQDYNSVDAGFVNGVNDVPATATAALAYYTAAGFTVDTNKNVLSPFDGLTRAQLNEISTWLSVALVPADTKAILVRKIETAFSLKIRTALTVTSVQTANAGESTITVTSPALTGTNIHKYKAAAVAPALLYGDDPDATWVTFTSGAVITPLVTGQHIGVVECDVTGTFVYGYGTVVIDATP